jgi:hypothetical protein
MPRPRKTFEGKALNGRKGKPNYNRDLVLEAVATERPKSAAGWKKTAELYQELSREDIVRDYDDLKKHFVKKMCKENVKPTGRSSPDPKTAEAQRLYRDLENDAAVGVLGESDSEDSDEDKDEENVGDDIMEPFQDDFFPKDVTSVGCSSSSRPPLANSPLSFLTQPFEPALIPTNRKRKNESNEGDNKSKSARNVARSSAAGALNNLSATIREN